MALDVRHEPTRRSGGVQRRGLLASVFAFAMLAFTSVPALAQTGQVTGRVLDAQSGGPLSEVQVYIPGLQLGSLSRADGRFLILNVPAGTHEVRAERIGLSSQTQSVTVTAGGTATIDFRLESQALGLDEIVVTGTAGAARRREIGNSITQVNIADVPDRPTQVTNLLQGAAPGIEITGGSGQVGQGSQIRLRGNSSVGMSNQPIIYIDGVRMMDGAYPRVNTPGITQGRGARTTSSPIDNLNPNDIDRIEVIKGSAATTLYGTEASAGVIQIFTKRGASGAPVWSAEMQQGTGWIKQYGVNGVNYLNMEHFYRDAWWGGGYDGGEYGGPCILPNSPDNPANGFDETTRNYHWADENASAQGNCSFPGAAWFQNYNVSVRGGGENLQYFLSGSYQDDTGVMPLDELEKYNMQANFTFSPIDDLQIQWTTGFTRQWMQLTPSGNNLSGLELQSWRQERNYFSNGDPRQIAQILDYDHQQWIERVTTGITLNYNPIAEMTNRFTFGYDYNQQEGRNLMGADYWEVRSFGAVAGGALTSDLFQKRLLTFDYVGSYRFPITDAVRSTFSWGGQAIGEDERQIIGLGINFPGAAQPTLSSASVRRSEEEREKVWNAGFFFQNVFDISDRYFITFGLRVDGNSAFGEGFGLQTYPKVSGSWVVSDEDFWSESLGSLKVRAAYGQSGRAPGSFDAVRTWEPIGFLDRPAFQPENRGNPDLGPEVTSELELGFDGSWLNDRLSATFTWFSQKTTDALMNVSAIPSLGFANSQLENVGELENKGIELQVDASVVQGASWGVDLGLGVSTTYSKVLDLGDAEPFNALSGRIIEGHSVPVGWDRRVANRDELGNGWSNSEYVDGGENVIVGPIFPTHFITPSMTVRTPGNIIVSARGEYRGGNIVEVNPIATSRSVRSPICFPYYVDPEAGITLKSDIPAIWRERCNPRNADDYWFDGDYFKLRSVSATIPVDFAFPDRVSNASLTLTLANSYDWYREIPWHDVEITADNGAGQAGEGFANASERTPPPATFRISLRVTF